MRRRRKERGAAMVELAVVLPVFVLVLLFGAFLTDLACVRLELQEAARFSAWSLTSRRMEDWETARHDERFERVSSEAKAEVQEKYPLATQEERSLGAIVGKPELTLTNADVPLGPGKVDVPALGEVLSGAGKFVQQPMAAVLRLWGLDVQGAVTAELKVEVTAPGELLDDPLEVHEAHALIASTWHIPDGRDATVTKDAHRAGTSPEGEVTDYWRQVDRLTFLGGKNLPGGVADVLRGGGSFVPIPNPFGTYLISHGYTARDVSGRAQGSSPEKCNVDPGRGGGTSGMHNLATKEGGHPRLLGAGMYPDASIRCFDTAPFRDRHAYQKSLHRMAFRARGPWFMGCKRAQADDPTGNSGLGGRHRKPVECAEGE